MAFDVNEAGIIKLTPLVSHEVAAVYDVGCLMRLVLARPEDRPIGTGSLIVQLAISFDQLDGLLADLQKAKDHLLKTPGGTPN